MAIPRVYHSGAAGVALPQPLSPADAAVMRRIFAFQARGNIPDAVKATEDLRNPLLLGAVLADRYQGRRYRSTAAELSDWLDHYADQPDAPAIYALLNGKLPKGAQRPVAPAISLMPITNDNETSALTDPEPGEADLGRNDIAIGTPFEHAVMERAQSGKLAVALRMISRTRRLPAAQAAWYRAKVAQGAFIGNQDTDALRIAQDSLRTTAAADQNSLTFLAGGLAAWRMGRVEQARQLFEGGAGAAIASPRLRSACAFWASRASRRLHDGTASAGWLQQAAGERMTFYGILARRILRMDIGPVPDAELLTDADVDAVATTPQGLRAFALLQIDQPDRAQAELRTLWPMIQANPVFGRSVLLVASATGLTDFAAQLAGQLPPADGHPFDALRFPIPRLRPSGGFHVDPALVYALTRRESNFDSQAVSPGGARGLMQIMPATAHYVAADLRGGARLHDPAVNLAVGQRYVSYLADLDGIDGDLIRLLSSYNSGPGNFLRWVADMRDDGDPLLFLEAIPVAETRDFVPNVLAASWIYAARMHRAAPSLDSLVADEFPRFTPMERQGRVASAEVALH